jgi:PTH1 family peptidyl-tRNA hydrolase
MWLGVGLGNPGLAYKNNRHNAGFMALDGIVRRYGSALLAWRQNFKSETCEFGIAGDKFLALKPLTFMNISGEAVGEAARFYKIPAEQVIVLHDELDLPLGRVEAKRGGGHAGHNGLKSITAHIGAAFWRIRLGIGHPLADADRSMIPKEARNEIVSNYVLGNFAKAEQGALETMLDEAADVFIKVIEQKVT